MPESIAHTLLARPSYDDIRLGCHVLFGVTVVSATFLFLVSKCRNYTSVLRSHAGLQLSSGQVSHLPPGASLRIKKAVITAAGQSQRALPLPAPIDRDGQEKPVLCILIEQALAANVEEICVVVWPGDEARYADAAGRHAPTRVGTEC